MVASLTRGCQLEAACQFEAKGGATHEVSHGRNLSTKEALLLALGVASLLGCASKRSHPPPCGTGFLGDPASPVVLQVTVLGGDGTSSTIANGDMLPLLRTAQGGRDLYIGVRAMNIDACGVSVSAVIRDERNQDVKIDERPVDLAPASDGFGTSTDSNTATFANLTACPNGWAATNVYDHTFQLTVTVKDSAGRTGTTTLRVTPTCADPPTLAECLCVCQYKYMMGQPCDAGTD